MGMLSNSKTMKREKRSTNKSSKELLEARSKTTSPGKGKAGRPTKYPKDENTKRMNVFIPGDIHKQLRQASVDLDRSMNEIILDTLVKHLAA